MVKIYVDSEEEKQQLLDESEYIHYFVKVCKHKGKKKIIGLDSDKANTLMHIYTNPDMIIINTNE